MSVPGSRFQVPRAAVRAAAAAQGVVVPPERSKLERRFLEVLAAYLRDVPAPEEQYAFVLAADAAAQARYVAPQTRRPRRWAFDFAWPAAKVAVELDGGLFRADGGRHNTRGDAEKLRAAQDLGWIVLHFTVPELRNAATVAATVRAVLEGRSRSTFQVSGSRFSEEAGDG